MNELIKKLKEQATSYTWNGNDVTEELDEEKFAALIIEECIAQCWSVSELEHNGYVVSECSKRVRKHFGVEQ